MRTQDRSQLANWLTWWIEGLVLCLPVWLLNRLSNREYPILLWHPKRLLLVKWPRLGKVSGGRLAKYHLNKPEEIKAFNDKLAQYDKRKTRRLLALPKGCGLSQSLTFPLQAEKELDRILFHEIDRVTPFSPDLVYYAYEIQMRDNKKKILQLELQIAPKTIIDEKLNSLATLDFEPDEVMLHPKKWDAINLLPQTTKPKTPSHLRKLNLVLISILLLLGSALLALPFWQQEKHIASIETQLNDAKKAAQVTVKLKQEWQGLQDQIKAINKQTQRFTPVTQLLQTLTRLIPEDSWVTNLSLNNDVLQLRGESKSASRLIQILENAPEFTDTKFRSPVVNQNNGKESMDIITHLHSRSKWGTDQ